MRQGILQIDRPGRAADATRDCASVVALDRQNDEEILLRFLMSDNALDHHAKQVRLTRQLAEQLLQMLADELEESSQPFHYPRPA